MSKDNITDISRNMSDMRFKTEMERCEYCEEKPCKTACPADCSPADFIMAAREGTDHDIRRAALLIMKDNPLGGVCGAVCPDRHCMRECSHRLFDGAINIPELQAEIIERAKRSGGIPAFSAPEPNGIRAAVIGAGPAGLGAAAVLAQSGYKVDIFESNERPGGMARLIPDHRLNKETLDSDIEFIKGLGDISIINNRNIDRPAALMDEGYAAVIAAFGLWQPIAMNLDNEDTALKAVDYLSDPGGYDLKGNIAVIGGGATALDCAVTAVNNGAGHVEMFSLENLSEMPLTAKERKELVEYGIEVSGRTRVTAITGYGGIRTCKVSLDAEKFDLGSIKDVPGTGRTRDDISGIIIAIGHKPALAIDNDTPGIFYAGDFLAGPTTVVEAVASGKNAALEADSYINDKENIKTENIRKNSYSLPGYVSIPVDLETDFFGRNISTPFLLSAAPPTDGLEQMKKAYKAGWSGGIMKTAFDGVPIHIPSEYMHVFNNRTYGNCDNVSGHALSRVCREVEELVRLYPDRLTMASTGGPVTGNDDEDMAGWQSNTKKLEAAGVMGIEYSLSCPQGGDGTEGDIVSQNAELTAKIISWILESGDGNVPKLFKLTAAVTSIVPIINAIKEVIARFPGKKAGVTLANTFPVMDFMDPGNCGEKPDRVWEQGVVYGMSGEGVCPISFFTLARAVPVGVTISGNAGPMNYRQAADFLALGAGTVQFCTIVMKYGYGIIDELKNGISYLMESRGISSIKELTGIAHPGPITDFMELSSEKKISDTENDLCAKCGNCTRCSYMAISLDEEGYPVTDPEKCVGCSICVGKCFTGAMHMRERTPEEAGVLKED
ncbi:MAG: FAD-dependent oxidoreductase [Elusimicrobiota bacterium]